MLYALGVGMGADPMDEKELAFVYERELKALPTFASVVPLAAVTSTGRRRRACSCIPVNPDRGTASRISTFHKPMPAAAKIKTKGRTLGVFDKGKDKGAVVVNETVITDEAGDPIATIQVACSPAATAASAARPRASPNPTRSRPVRPIARSTSRPGPTRR